MKQYNKDLLLILIILLLLLTFLNLCWIMGGTESGKWYNGEIACIMVTLELI